VAVPATLAGDIAAAHRVEPGVEILEAARPGVVQPRASVGGGRPLVEDPLRRAFTAAQAFREEVFVCPRAQQPFLQRDEIEVTDSFERHCDVAYRPTFAEPCVEFLARYTPPLPLGCDRFRAPMRLPTEGLRMPPARDEAQARRGTKAASAPPATRTRAKANAASAAPAKAPAKAPATKSARPPAKVATTTTPAKAKGSAAKAAAKAAPVKAPAKPAKARATKATAGSRAAKGATAAKRARKQVVVCPLSGFEITPGGAGLSPKTIARLRGKLLEEKARHVRQAEELLAEAEELARDREQGDTQFDEESGEGDTVNVERERDLMLSASARQVVEEVDRALERIKKGTYGFCVPAGRKIALERLEAIPWAEECVDCKARAERRR